MSEQSKAIEGANTPSENMSFQELIARRTEAHSPADETEEQVPAEEEADEEALATVADDIEATTEGDEVTEESEEEEEQEEIDLLLSKTPEEIQQIAKRGKSRLLQRIGELTAKSKALEEKLASAQGAEAKPLQAPVTEIPEDIRALKTVEELQAKYAELEKVAEETDRILEDHEDYGPNDPITLWGKEFTKKDIRTANRNARNALLKALPAQHAEIQRSEQRAAMEAEYNAAIPLEIPELADEASDMAKQFNAMLADPLIDQVKRHVPELAPQIAYLLAHAVRSLNSKKPLAPTRQAAPGTLPKPKVAGNPVGAAAARSGATPARKQGDAAYQQFEQTGSVESWIAARAARKV